MNLLVTLIGLGVFAAFAYHYLRESRIPELIERYRPHDPVAGLPEPPTGDIGRHFDPRAAEWYAESRRSGGIRVAGYEEPQREAS